MTGKREHRIGYAILASVCAHAIGMGALLSLPQIAGLSNIRSIEVFLEGPDRAGSASAIRRESVGNGLESKTQSPRDGERDMPPMADNATDAATEPHEIPGGAEQGIPPQENSGSIEPIQTDAGDARSGIGRFTGSAESYAARVLSTIEAHKWYPFLARLKNIEGTPVLAFRIDREGHPTDTRIERSSWSSVLDAAAMATIEHISNFPPPPAEIGDRRIWIVPIRYQMEDLPRD